MSTHRKYGKGCSYSKLGCYQKQSTMTKKGHMVVPTYGAIGYEALTHGGKGSCGGYFDIRTAYERESCPVKYRQKRCDGCSCNGGTEEPVDGPYPMPGYEEGPYPMPGYEEDPYPLPVPEDEPYPMPGSGDGPSVESFRRARRARRTRRTRRR